MATMWAMSTVGDSGRWELSPEEARAMRFWVALDKARHEFKRAVEDYQKQCRKR